MMRSQELFAPQPETDRSWNCRLELKDGKWELGWSEPTGLAKTPGLQGPIDDAFLDSFVVARPTGEPWNKKVNDWATGEMDHFVKEWQRQFRGDAIVKADDEISEADIAGRQLDPLRRSRQQRGVSEDRR